MMMSAHGNLGRTGAFQAVLQLLSEHPDGLTSIQICELAVERKIMEEDSSEGSRGLYFRVKRALASLEKLGYVKEGEKRIYVAVPGAVDADLKAELRKALMGVQERIKNRIPLRDANQLLAAFEGVLDENAMELGIKPREVEIGEQAFLIRKEKRKK